VGGRQWTTSVAGLPCAIETTENGSWVVTLASTTRSRRGELVAAILEAGGGLVSKEEAVELAASVQPLPAQLPAPRTGKRAGPQ
jgi:hypothetical protein